MEKKEIKKTGGEALNRELKNLKEEKGKDENPPKWNSAKQEEQTNIIKQSIKNQNKQILFILAGIVAIFLVVFLTVLIINMSKNFQIDGVKFQVVNEIAPYKTSLPLMFNGTKVNYNFYLRKDPRKTLKNIPFNDSLILTPTIVFNSSGDLTCNGSGIIAIANLANLLEVLQFNVFKDKNATCDQSRRYTLIQIEEGNKSEVQKTGPSCYTLKVNNCEMLDVNERFMLQVLIEANKALK